MKLQERFSQQKQVSPTDLQKMRIYQRFLDKSHRSLRMHKIAYYAKVGIFSFVILVVGGMSYLGIEQSSEYAVLQDHQKYAIVTPSVGTVQADVLGKVLKTQGNIVIWDTKNNQKIQSTELHGGERVVLEKGAEIEFSVRDDVIAKISGPAEVELQALGIHNGIQNYAINLLRGDYIEVTSIDKKRLGKKLGRGEEPLSMPSKDNIANHIVIQSPTFSIETKNIAEKMNIVVTKGEDGGSKIENKGAEIVLKTITENEQQFIAIAPHQKVLVDKQVNFVDVDIQQLKQKVAKKQLTVRYEIKHDKVSSVGAPKVEAKSVADVLQEISVPAKKKMDKETLQKLDQLIGLAWLEHTANQVEQYYYEQNDAAFSLAVANLLEKLDQAYRLVGKHMPSVSHKREDVGHIARIAEQLAYVITQNYDIETSHVIGLYTLSNILQGLQEKQKENEDSVSTENQLHVPAKTQSVGGGTKEIKTKKTEKIRDASNEGRKTIEEQLRALEEGTL